MTTQTQTPEERLSKLEGAYEQANERFNDLRTDMNERFNELARGQDALREEVSQVETSLREEIRQGDASLRAEMRTLLLLLGTSWATTMGGIIAILVRG